MIKLPKPYLSWSQINLWQRSPRSYAKRYFEGEKGFKTYEMAFGSSFGEAIEQNNLFAVEDRFLPAIASIEPMYWHEYPITIQRNGYYLLGYIDGAREDLSLIHEYKTGKGMWTQAKAEKHGQLKLYSAGIMLHKGVAPECRLIWFETEGQGDDIQLTGQKIEFEVRYDDFELFRFLDQCDEVAKEISEYYQLWVAGQVENEKA